MDETYLDDLFAQAKTEAPRTEFGAVHKRFAASVAAGAPMGSGAMWKGLFSLNSILIGLTAVTLIGLAIMNYGQADATRERAETEITAPTALRAPTSSPPTRTKEPKSAQVIALPDTLNKDADQTPTRAQNDEKTAASKSILTSSNDDMPKKQRAEPSTPTEDAQPSTNPIASRGGASKGRTQASEEVAPATSDIVRRHIDEHTTEMEIKSLLDELDRAGISWEYQVKDRRNVRRRLKLALKGQKKSSQIVAENGAKWRIDVAWRIDGEGNATELLSTPDSGPVDID